MFYDRFEALCAQKGVRPGRACVEMGLSRSLAAKWKATGVQRPGSEALEKMSAYFGVPVDALLGSDGPRPVTDEEIKFALFGGDGEITDAMYDEVKAFAQYLKERNRKKG